MAGIGLIVNRNAAGGRRFSCRMEKRGFVLGDPDSLCETSTVEEIEEVARAFCRADIDVLAIWGGDGSNHHVLSTFIRVYGDRPLPRVAFLRGGTHNACARSIGLSGSPEAILERIVRRYHAGTELETTTRAMLRVDHGDGVHHGFSLATGFLYRFFEKMHRERRTTAMGVAAMIARSFGGFLLGSRRIAGMFERASSRVLLGDELVDWPENNGVACATMEEVGLGIRPFSRVCEQPGCFHAMVFRVTPARFARVAWSFARGHLGDHEQHLDRVTDRLVVESERPVAYALDGDLFRAGGRLEVTTGPRLQLVTV